MLWFAETSVRLQNQQDTLRPRYMDEFLGDTEASLEVW